jgi:uncharacterized protein (DUF2062 family)
MRCRVRRALRQKIVDPLRAQLTQGVTPGRLAAALALGLAIGTLPLLGVTTLVCALLAAALRLNQPAVQVANYLAYPLQLVLLVPFFEAGAWLFGRPPVDLTVAGLRAELAADLVGTVVRYLGVTARAVVAWGLVAPVVAVLLFVALRPLLARLPRPAALPIEP